MPVCRNGLFCQNAMEILVNFELAPSSVRRKVPCKRSSLDLQ